MKTQTEERIAIGSEGEGGDLVHCVWPSEYPLALCGAILPQPTLAESSKKVLGPFCEDCAGYAEGRTRARQNPHRQQGG